MFDEQGDIGIQPESEASNASWIVTYADLVTLILTFFVLLYSMSNLELKRFKVVMQSIKIGLGQQVTAVAEPQEAVEPVTPPMTQEAYWEMRNQSLLDDLKTLIRDRGLDENIVVSLENGRIVIRVKNHLFFSSGRAQLNASGMPILDDILVIFRNCPDYRINIAGHTDDTPIYTVQFPSNWELSTTRATVVLRYLIERGIDPHRMTATGYADLMPLVSNDNADSKAQNRRVEFILEKEIEG